MQHPGLVSRHSLSRCSGCRQRWGCYHSQMFITATANCFHSSSTHGWFLILFTPSQAGWFMPLSPCWRWLWWKAADSVWSSCGALEQPPALGWPTGVVISGSCVSVLSSQQDHLQPAHSTSGHRVFGYLRWSQEYMISGHLSSQNANYSLWKKWRVERKLCLCYIQRLTNNKNNLRVNLLGLLHTEQN